MVTTSSSTQRLRQAPRSAQILAGVLLAVPVLAVLLVPIYSRTRPTIWGWPFFYWYQVLWIVVCPVFTGLAAMVLKRARAGTAAETGR
jgi:Protein of unknown function (DUF3311)